MPMPRNRFAVTDSRDGQIRLRRSLMLLGIVVAIALAGLAAAGNWPKVVRVALAAVTYAALLVLVNRRRIRLPAFMLSGAVAGFVSGMARPATSLLLVMASVLGAGLLLAPMHWLALVSGSSRSPGANGAARGSTAQTRLPSF